MFWLLLTVFGVFSGITTLLFGFGGGFIAVPLLYSLIRMLYPPGSVIEQSAMHIAVATSTAAMMFSAGFATLRRHKAGQLAWDILRPLWLPVAAGALIGAITAMAVSGRWIQWCFVAYLSFTLCDVLLRRGFVHSSDIAFQPLSARRSIFMGLGIGIIAAFLGVGGSVLTVPMMRRRGASMSQASALANPLSLPMAISGSLVYGVLAWQGGSSGDGFVGYIDWPALAVLVTAAWCGIQLGYPLMRKLPDGIHARAYVALLILMLVVMLVSSLQG